MPGNLAELLTARGLAYWIMDDGSKHEQTKIHTESFTKIELKKTDKGLNKDQWIIYIPVI